MDEESEFDKTLAAAMRTFSNGDLDAARSLLETARVLDPNHPEVWFGLGAVAWRAGRWEDGINAMDKAASLAPSVWKYWDLLIRSLIQVNLYDVASKTCEASERAGNETGPLYHYWGYALQRLEDFGGAVEKFTKAVALAPEDKSIWRNMSVPLFHVGRAEESVRSFSTSTVALDAIDQAGGSRVGADHFNQLAGDYDGNSLHQAMVEQMVGFVAEIRAGGISNADMLLDCGCGTGLLGSFIDTDRQRMTGLDLSPRMVERARETKAYETLIVGDMVEEMARLKDRFDVIISSGAIFYISDLKPFFDAASRLLVDGGHLFFGTEPCDDEHDIRATGDGEFAHSRAYMRRLADRAGLRTVEIRIMMHRAFPGFWCAFRRLPA